MFTSEDLGCKVCVSNIALFRALQTVGLSRFNSRSVGTRTALRWRLGLAQQAGTGSSTYGALREPSDARSVISFHEESGLITYVVMSSGKLPTFRRRLLFPSSGFKYPVATCLFIAWKKLPMCLDVVYYDKEIMNKQNLFKSQPESIGTNCSPLLRTFILLSPVAVRQAKCQLFTHTEHYCIRNSCLLRKFRHKASWTWH